MSTRREALWGLGCGLLFAGGLVLSGMTDPARVLGFLDFAGAWDSRLLWVMVGAIGVHFSWLRFALRRQGPAALVTPSLPPRAKVDRPLVLGAAVFGIGWGLSGYCPGPAVVSAGAGLPAAAVFVAAMLGGMYLCRAWQLRSSPAVGLDPGSVRRA